MVGLHIDINCNVIWFYVWAIDLIYETERAK